MKSSMKILALALCMVILSGSFAVGYAEVFDDEIIAVNEAFDPTQDEKVTDVSEPVINDGEDATENPVEEPSTDETTTAPPTSPNWWNFFWMDVVWPNVLNTEFAASFFRTLFDTVVAIFALFN